MLISMKRKGKTITSILIMVFFISCSNSREHVIAKNVALETTLKHGGEILYIDKVAKSIIYKRDMIIIEFDDGSGLLAPAESFGVLKWK